MNTEKQTTLVNDKVLNYYDLTNYFNNNMCSDVANINFVSRYYNQMLIQIKTKLIIEAV